MNNFEIIWDRIIKHQGQKFLTVKGLPFTYTIVGNIFRTNRTNFTIHKRNFIKAYGIWPVDKPGQISRLVMGPSYVWGVLNDKRIV